MSEYVCDCGKTYEPNVKKYGDERVKCSSCIRKTRSHDVKVKCVDYLGGKCKDCRQIYHPVIFDFDHDNGITKEFKISGKYIFRWKELRKELDKCTLRCSNCHRLRHWMEKYGD